MEEISYQLARAAYEEEDMRKLAVSVFDDVQALSDGASLEKLLQKHNINPSTKARAVDIRGVGVPTRKPEMGPHVNGLFVEVGTHNGHPAFQHGPCYFIWDSAWSRWTWSSQLADRSFFMSINKPKLAGHDFYDKIAVGTSLEEGYGQGLTDEPGSLVVLTIRQADVPLAPEIERHLQSKDVQFPTRLPSGALVQLRFGPPKGLGRCLEKGPAALTDLNRCTFTTRSLTLLLLTYELLRAKLARAGGEVVALKNKFMSKSLDQPPNLHLSVRLQSGWLVEIQLTLYEFVEAKKGFHKVYELNRAKDFREALRPVYKLFGPETPYAPPSGTGKAYDLRAF